MNLNAILDISHINEHITKYLEIRDIVKCSHVSHQWHSFFNPVVWHKPRRPFKGEITTATLLKYQSHVRVIDSAFITRKILESLDSGWIFNNLQKLYFDYHDVTQVQTAQKWFQWVQGIKGLREFGVEISLFDSLVHASLLSTLRSLPMLSSFSALLSSSHQNKFTIFSKQEIIMACSHLDSLSFIDISAYNYREISEEELPKPIMAMSDSQQMNIKKLDIRLLSHDEESLILIPLLEMCHNLRSLTLNSEFHNSTVISIARIFKSGSFIKLDELNLRVIREVDRYNTGLATILDAYKEAFDEKRYMIGLGHGLHSFSLGNRLEIYKVHMQPILTFHITKLVLLDTTRIGIPLFSELMHNLPTLKSVQAAILVRLLPFDVEQSEWRCHELIDLKILVDGFAAKATAGTSSLDASYTYLFRQIGKLGKLKEFDLTSRSQDLLSIKGKLGYIRHLSGLKQLRSLRITANTINLGDEDAQWILNNWPKLNFVQGMNCKLEPTFKSSLLEGRPNITII